MEQFARFTHLIAAVGYDTHLYRYYGTPEHSYTQDEKYRWIDNVLYWTQQIEKQLKAYEA